MSDAGQSVGGKKEGAKGPTRKVGTGAAALLKKGVCGYHGRKKKLPMISDDAPKPISCEEHHCTWETCYKYLEEAECHSKYKGEVEFGASVDSSHGSIHRGEDKTCNEGQVSKETEYYQECGRTYGAYDTKELLERLPRPCTQVIPHKFGIIVHCSPKTSKIKQGSFDVCTQTPVL